MPLPSEPGGGARPLRVLHLVGGESDHGGILTVLRNVQAVTGQRGWRHTVWVREGYVERRSPALDYRRCRHLLDEASSHLRLTWHAARAWPELRRLLRTEPFDVVHGHSRGAFWLNVWLARLARRPTVFTSHARGTRAGLYRWAARQPRMHLVLISPEMAEHYRLVPAPPKISLIPSGCAQRFFELPLATGSRRADPARRLRFVGLGNVVRWKGWDLALRALARLPESLRSQCEFQLWGPVPDDPDARRFAAELAALIVSGGLQDVVSLCGPTAHVTGVLQGADWLLHPTTNEPAGVALVEAIALGVPALVSASGGPRDTVTPGLNGRHFRPDDVADLATQLAAIIRGEVRLPAAAELRESVRSRSALAMAEQLAPVYAACTVPAR
jgi:D-inositol-3-phosphate glycosyltransferase